MIRILAIIMIGSLAIIAFYLKKYYLALSVALGQNKNNQLLETLFKQLINSYWVLSAIGIAPLVINDKLFLLLYIACVLLLSAFFSIKISKAISL